MTEQEFKSQVEEFVSSLDDYGQQISVEYDFDDPNAPMAELNFSFKQDKYYIIVSVSDSENVGIYSDGCFLDLSQGNLYTVLFFKKIPNDAKAPKARVAELDCKGSIVKPKCQDCMYEQVFDEPNSIPFCFYLYDDSLDRHNNVTAELFRTPKIGRRDDCPLFSEKNHEAELEAK